MNTVKTDGPAVRHAGPVDSEQIDSILTAAFIADPPVRWLFPDEAVYHEAFPPFARAFGGGPIMPQAIDLVEGAAVARWIPPGATVDEDAVMQVLGAYVPEDRHPDLQAVFGALEEHHPVERHWYLPLLGVVPAMQGMGIGAALMRAGLARCDAQGMSAYLEASSIRNVPFYQRLGFEVRGLVRVKDCPPIYPMCREARRS